MYNFFKSTAKKEYIKAYINLYLFKSLQLVEKF